MTEFHQMLIAFGIFTILISACVAVLGYIQGTQNERKKNNQQYFESAIKDILGEMYIDEEGNNVLNGGTEEYETKWRYEIGYNYGLQKAIRILKSHINQ